MECEATLTLRLPHDPQRSLSAWRWIMRAQISDLGNNAVDSFLIFVGQSLANPPVVLVVVEARKTSPLSGLQSRWFLQPCVRLADYCAERELEIDQVLEILQGSAVSFGSNDDTLVRETRLCQMLGIEPIGEERCMISLGG